MRAALLRTPLLRALLLRALRFGPVAATAGVAVYSAAMLRPPTPAPCETALDAFSATRAMRTVRAIAREPHPIGTPAADRVRDDLVGELKELGLDVEVQDAFAANDLGPTPYGPRYRTAGRVRNVIARLAGTEPGEAVLLMSHYDSVAQGPGASDAGVPVAALLEAVRALRESGPLRNDLLVVLTDGEEAGLLGARAFFAEHRLASDVGVVLNFDARGTSGPVLMFEAGPGHGPAVQHLARAGTPVFASSLFDEIYRRMPNATDFTHAKQRGIPGLNFAHIGGFVHYHGPLDDVEHVDPGSLQHHGELALALARRLGSADLSALSGDDEVFFTVGAGRLVHYRRTMVLPLAAATALVWAATLRRMLHTGELTGRGLGVGLAMLLGRFGVSVAASTALVTGLGRRAPEFRRHGDFHGADEVFSAVAGLVAAAVLAVDTGNDSARLASVTAPLALANGVLATRLAGGSYLATWPLLGSSLGMSLLGRDAPPAGRALGCALAAVPAAVLFAPLSRLLFQGLTPRMAGTSAVAMQLLGELVSPALAELPRAVRRCGAAGGLALAAGVAVRRLLRPPPQPHPVTLSYLIDTERRTALWLSSDRSPTEWTRPALGHRPVRGPLEAYFPGWRRDFLQAPAPVLDLPGPEAVLIKDHAAGKDHRRVVLQIRSVRGARQLSLAITGTPVRWWQVEGRAPSVADHTSSDSWELWLHAVPETGVTVELELPSRPVEVRLLDREDGLPLPLWTGPPSAGGAAPAAALDVDTWGNATLVVRCLRI